MTEIKLIFAILVVSVLSFFSVSCTQNADFVFFRNGDLVFVEGDSGNQFESAITGATGEMSHVGIVEVANDSVYVIDASTAGVRRQPFADFVENQRSADGVFPKFHFCRLKDAAYADRYVANANSLIGCEYDFSYLPENGRYYCSELVYDCYVHGGRHVFETVPMNFRNKDGGYDDFWVELFAEQGMEIPQDVPGTNPTGIYRSDAVMELDVPYMNVE